MPMNLSELLEERIAMNLTLGDVKPARLNEAVRRVHLKFPPVDIPELESLEERLAIFLERLKTNDWLNYKLSEASALARDFFGSDLATDPKWKPIKDDFLTELEAERNSFVRSCFAGYLASFKERSSLTKQLAKALKNVDQSTLGPMSKFAEQFNAFSPRGLPDRISSNLKKHEQPYEKIREYGVGAPHAFALFDDVFISLIEDLEPKLKVANRKAVEQIKNWLRPNAEYKMETGYNIGVEAILKPYLRSDPPNDIKKDILNFLIDAYGDPRISTGSWSSIDARYIKLINQWLTGESLKTFFKIISKFEGSEMWGPRRVFWESIFDMGWIQDAWPILNEDGVRYLRELAAQDNNNNFLQYGKMRDNYQDQTCYFAMRIGNLLVVEGSHSFAIRFFKVGNRKATTMHKTTYKKYELVISKPPADERITHNGNWQQRTSRYLQLNR